MRRGWLIDAASLLVLILVFAGRYALGDLVLARGDTLDYFYPYWAARDAALRAGQLPLWSPDLFMGVPLWANPQVGTFYPPNWVTVWVPVSDALRLHVLLHLLLASLGMYAAFRRIVGDARIPALLAGVLFALTGPVIAHVEQINQLQGLAWVPWALLLADVGVKARHRAQSIRALLGLSAVFALQLFTGHTQTVFITGVMLGLFVLIRSFDDGFALRGLVVNLLWLMGASVAALLLAVPQLLPTLELTGMSNRGGGFTPQEATAFSLPPDSLPQALLPAYETALFTEYIGYIGVIGLLLALLALFTPDDEHRIMRRVAVVFVVVGVLFALGRFNPVYWQLAHLPGFSFFRVPARWLTVAAVGWSLLAGMGLYLATSRHLRSATGVSTTRPYGIVGSLMLLAILREWVVADVLLWRTALIWAGALGFFVVLWRWAPQHPRLWFAVVLLEVLAASLLLPLRDLVPPDVVETQRFTVSQMQALANQTTAPGRVLAISDLNFDPGDRGALRTRFEQRAIGEEAVQIAFTAIKKQEALFPNQSLRWGFPSVDGFGGGLLPTIYTTQFTSLLLPDAAPLRAVDGRMGQILADDACDGACIPAAEWLDATSTRYLLADKVFDLVQEGVFYDTTLSRQWAEATSPPIRPELIFDEVRVIHRAPLPENIATTEPESVAMRPDYSLSVLSWEAFERLVDDAPESIVAVTVVDTRVDVFESVQPPGWRRILSSDIKIYERRTDAPHLADRAVLIPAFVAHERFADDYDGHEAALRALRAGETTFALHDPVAPLLTPPDDYEGAVIVESYAATEVVLSVQTNAPAYLLLRDAWYPGWRALLNGDPVPVQRANVMFRAVRVPAGEHTVAFTFEPLLWWRSLWFGRLAWGLWCVGMLIGLKITRNNPQSD